MEYWPGVGKVPDTPEASGSANSKRNSTSSNDGMFAFEPEESGFQKYKTGKNPSEAILPLPNDKKKRTEDDDTEMETKETKLSSSGSDDISVDASAQSTRVVCRPRRRK